MLKYHRWLNQLPGSAFGDGYWPKIRFGDNIETALLALQSHRRTLAAGLWPRRSTRTCRTGPAACINWHNVNIAQGFREPGVYFLQARDQRFLACGRAQLRRRSWNLYGQFPGGGFGGDENCRPGYTDPRQGFETCGIVEFMHSFEMLTRDLRQPALVRSLRGTGL